MHNCPSCRRHIREAVCPFCRSETSSESPVVAGPPLRSGLRRGALVASVVAMAACGPSIAPAYGIPVDASTDAAADQQQQDAAPVDAAGNDAPDEAIVAMYGIPPMDASEDVNVMPPYGLPPEDSGTE